MTPSDFTVRRATEEDIPVVHKMIQALAHFERLTHLCVATQDDIFAALFGPQPAAEALIAWENGDAAGFALYFLTFSTFRGRRNLWLEDLFVQPDYRQRGCAKALLRALATLAVKRNCARFEWTVLDWNAQAIGFYEGLGATVLPDWRIVRMEGNGLTALAAAENC